MAIELHGQNIIGGELSARDKTRFRGFDPAAGSDLEPEFAEATVEEVDAAMKAAAGAFEEYRQLTADRRAEFLDKIADEIMALGEQLIQRCSAETGLPAARLEGERGRTCNQLRIFAALIREGSWVQASVDTAIPDRKPIPKPDLRRMLIALGPVVVFGASNFPLAYSVAGGDTASALAAGCPVVVKAHPAHPGACELVATAIVNATQATNMPRGVFSMIHGRSNDVGMALVRHPLTCAVGFTGSQLGGRALFYAAAARDVPIPVYAEMGSVNPVFILPGALKERGTAIAAGLAQSVTLGVGQFCTNPGLVIAPGPARGNGSGDAMESFLHELAGKIADTPPATMLHAGIREAYERGLSGLSEIPGVRIVSKSKAGADAAKTQAGACVLATDAKTFLKHRQIADEVFGPSTVIVATGSTTELQQIARQLDGHLTATVHATEDDLKQHAQLIAILETKAGRLIYNGFPTGVEVCPSMQHGGPYPATTDSRTTSVGTAAILRFARPVSYQSFPQSTLPLELRDDNPRKIWRIVNGEFTKDTIKT